MSSERDDEGEVVELRRTIVVVQRVRAGPTSSVGTSWTLDSSGYELDPRHPCETYSVFGRRPNVDTTGRSIVCVTHGRLVSALGVNVQLDELSSLFVDKSVK